MAFSPFKILSKKSSKNELLGFIRTLAAKSNLQTAEIIAKEKLTNAQNYAPVPVVIVKGQGVNVWDPEGRKYLDFLAGFASVNFGHTHPKLLKVLLDQASKLSHVSRAYYNDVLPEFTEFSTKYFKYDKVIVANTGVEGGETAVKIARRWGYRNKNIPNNKAIVVFAENNFWGRTLAAISSSTNPVAYEDYGPYMPGFQVIPYDNTEKLEETLKNPNVCAFMIEPIQGEAGVVVPSERYLQEVRRLCTKYNVLWIADEIQTGLGRTGKLLAVDHYGVRPDLLIVGKALGGGFLPISAVFTSTEVMDVITPGSHGSTFGGNPLAAKVAIASLKLLQEENLIQNSARMGEKFRAELKAGLPSDVITDVRGRGLMNAICINPEFGTAWDLCIKLKELGLLSKPCTDDVLRFTPPLILSEIELQEGIEIIINAVSQLKTKC